MHPSVPPFQPLMAVDLDNIDTLVMAGGGNRCWWQAGLVQALIQRGWTLPQNITATSAGAAIATSLMAGTTEAALVACKKLYAANAQLFDWNALIRLKVNSHTNTSTLRGCIRSWAMVITLHCSNPNLG